MKQRCSVNENDDTSKDETIENIRKEIAKSFRENKYDENPKNNISRKMESFGENVEDIRVEKQYENEDKNNNESNIGDSSLIDDLSDDSDKLIIDEPSEKTNDQKMVIKHL